MHPVEKSSTRALADRIACEIKQAAPLARKQKGHGLNAWKSSVPGRSTGTDTSFATLARSSESRRPVGSLHVR